MCADTYFKVHHNFHSLHDNYMDSKDPTTVNPLHNHAHFSHGLVCVIFLVIITLVSSTKYLQSFLCKCDYDGKNLGQIFRFYKL
jgi:hypothetical protein